MKERVLLNLISQLLYQEAPCHIVFPEEGNEMCENVKRMFGSLIFFFFFVILVAVAIVASDVP